MATILPEMETWTAAPLSFPIVNYQVVLTFHGPRWYYLDLFHVPPPQEIDSFGLIMQHVRDLL